MAASCKNHEFQSTRPNPGHSFQLSHELGHVLWRQGAVMPLIYLAPHKRFARLFKDRIILIRQCFIRLSVSLLVGVNTNLIDEAAALCVRILTRPHVPIMDKPNARRAIDIIYRHITQHRQNPIAQIGACFIGAASIMCPQSFIFLCLDPFVGHGTEWRTPAQFRFGKGFSLNFGLSLPFSFFLRIQTCCNLFGNCFSLTPSIP